ncbi:MAG TPA: DNA primase [Usitatibacteraceae bacterium]|nr:DNA primase [Usitatibacteraceae bacterium]
MIPQDFIQTLLGRVDIVDVIDRHVRLKKAGANFKACCPFHNEKTPSFNVSPAKQFYHCFGCGVHGNAIGFVMEYSGLTYPDAIRELAQQAGMEVPEVQGTVPGRPAAAQAKGLTDRMMEALNYYRAELKRTPEAIEYLKGRGVSGEIAARFGLGFAPDAWQSLKGVFADYESAGMKDTGLVIDSEGGEGHEGEPAKKARRYDRFRGRVMFPILDSRGNVIGFGGRVLGDGEPKYLNSPETPLFEKGRELYGLWQARRAIRDANLVIVVEGYMDVVALAQHGVENAVATLGTATTPMHVAKLLKLADSVVFCFDGDSAGRKAAWKALEVSLPVLADGKSVAFLFLPQEDDPDTFVRRLGREAFLEALAGAKPLSQYLVSEIAAKVDMRSEEGRARFLAQAKPLVSQIEAPALGAMIRRRLAELAGLDPGELQGYAPQRDSWRPRPAPAARVVRRTHSLEAQILQRVLRKPDLARSVDPDLVSDGSAEGRALHALLAFVREGEAGLSLGQVIAHFDGSEHGPALDAAIAGGSILDEVPEAELDLAAELAGLQDKLGMQRSERRKAELEMRSMAAGLTGAEQAELAGLKARQAAAKGVNSALELPPKQ